MLEVKLKFAGTEEGLEKSLPQDVACGAKYEAGTTKCDVGLLSGKPRDLFELNYLTFQMIIRNVWAEPRRFYEVNRTLHQIKLRKVSINTH
jgi:hypothetical protein